MLHNYAIRIASDSNIVTGFQKHLMSGPPLLIAGATYSSADIIKMFEERVAALKANEAARAAMLTTLSKGNQELTSTKALAAAVRRYLAEMFAHDSAVLADFGLKPRKKPARATSASTVAKVQKAKATRKARHTMGPKQKAKIKGEVPASSLPAESPAAAQSVAQSPPPTPPKGSGGGGTSGP